MLTLVAALALAQPAPIIVPDGYSARTYSDGVGLIGPGGIAINEATIPRRLQVQDPRGNGNSGDAVYSVALDGAVTALYAPATGFSTCTVSSVATDPAGNTYVGNINGDSVVRIAPGGGVTTAATGLNGDGSCAGSVAMGLAFSTGNSTVYVGNPFNGSLQAIPSAQFGSSISTVETGIGWPIGLAYDAVAHRIIIADVTTDATRLIAYDIAGDTKSTLFTAPRGTLVGQGVAVDDLGAIYFTTGRRAIMRRALDGQIAVFACGLERQPFKLAFGTASDGQGKALYYNHNQTTPGPLTHDAAEDGIGEIRGPFDADFIRPAGCLLHPIELTPILEYRLAEGTGTATAQTGRYAGGAGVLQNNGVTGSGPTWSSETPPGMVDAGSLLFDGVDDSVRLTNDFDYTTTGAAGATALDRLTVEAWIRPADASQLTGQHAIWEDYGNPGVFLGLSGGNIQISISTAEHPGLGTGVFVGAVRVGEWNHIAAVYDGATIRTYLNGRQTCSTAATSGGIQNNPSTNAVRIGTDNAATSSLGFKGHIRDVRLYDAALTADQLALGFFAQDDLADADDDLDGVSNACDACPFDADKVERGPAGCGRSDADADDDDVPDVIDNCPDDDNPASPSDGAATVASGFTLEHVATVTVAAIVALVPADSEHAPGVYVAGDDAGAGGDPIVHVGFDGVATPFVSLDVGADPVAIGFAPTGSAFGGELFVTANNHDFGRPGDCGGSLLAIDEGGVVRVVTPETGTASCGAGVFATPLTEPNGLVFTFGTGFGDFVHLGNSTDAPNDVTRVDPLGVVTYPYSDGLTTTGLGLAAVALGVESRPWLVDLGASSKDRFYALETDDALVSLPMRVVDARSVAVARGGWLGDGTIFVGTATGGAGAIIALDYGGRQTTIVSGLAAMSLDALEVEPSGDGLWIVAGGEVWRLGPPAQPDADADGAGDACDACPDDPDKIASAGACGCGHPELDCSGLDGDCTVGACDATSGQCVALPANEDGDCDDGDPCTVEEACAGGACVGADKDCSGLDGDCTTGVCNAATGECEAVAANAGGGCEDGDKCTGGDTCGGGVCAGVTVDCGGLDDGCNDGACAPESGLCVKVPANAGGVCDDGKVCTTGDACGGGVCGGAAVSCAHLDGACVVGTCAEPDGCRAIPRNEGGSCQDGDPCTVGDACDGGACEGAAKDCSAADDACNVGTCDGETGACEPVPLAGSGACDDGDACTTGDACDAGACEGVAKDCTSLDTACTIGVCDVSGACVAMPRNEGGACNDGDACTTGDACDDGVCAGAAKDCSGLDSTCAIGTCDDGGTCVATPRNEGGACSDGNACTTGDACDDGVCAGAAKDCTGLDSTCAVGTCNGSGACVATPRNEGGACSDGDACTTSDACDDGVCAGAARDCSHLDTACAVGTCNGSGACVATPRNEGGACSDGDACTTGDACDAGACVGAAKDCTGLDTACAVGVCGQGGACVAAARNEGGACDDGDACTTGDACDEGACAGVAKDCTGLDTACAVGVCGQGGTCAATARNEGGACDDGDACTTGDACDGGACAGAAKDCSGLDSVCAVGACDESGACVATPTNEGEACDDGDPCTTGEACDGGACAGVVKDCSELDTECTEGVCGQDGACTFVTRNQGQACDDGNPCTLGETCAEGSCAGAPKDCSAFDSACTIGACDGSGACVAAPANEAEACDDGDLCTTGDRCDEGACAGEAKDCSELDDACSVGACDPATGTCEAEPIEPPCDPVVQAEATGGGCTCASGSGSAADGALALLVALALVALRGRGRQRPSRRPTYRSRP